VREKDAKASEDHIVARGGWNKTVGTSVESWEVEEDSGVARLSKK
jgi:hypothetical protein